MSGFKPVQLDSTQVLDVVTRALRQLRERLEHRIDAGEDTFVALHEDFSKFQKQIRETTSFLKEDGESVRADLLLQDERLKDHTRVELGKLYDTIQDKLDAVFKATNTRLSAYKDGLDERFETTEKGFEKVVRELEGFRDYLDEKIGFVLGETEGLSGRMDVGEDEREALTRRADDQENRTTGMDRRLEAFSSLLNDTVEKVDELDPDAWKSPLGKLDLRLSEHQALAATASEATKGALDEIRSEMSVSGETFAEKLEDLNTRLTTLDEMRVNLRADVDGLILVQDRNNENFFEFQKNIGTRFRSFEKQSDKLDKSVSKRLSELNDSLLSRIDGFFDERKTTYAQVSEIQKDFAESLDSLARDVSEFSERLVEDVKVVRDWASESFATKEEMETVRGEARDSLQAATEIAHDRITEVSGELQEHRDEVKRAFVEIESGVAELVTDSVSRARQWMPGPPYSTNDTVTWRNGTWIAALDTQQEPVFEGDWLLLADGIHDVELRQVAGETNYRLFVELSSGKRFDFLVKGPEQNYRGTWIAETKYRQGDIVMRDGSSYVALVHDPQGEPPKSKDWKITAMRGARGRRGECGPMPGMDDVLKTYIDYLEKGDGTPVVRFRGRWQLNATYRNGDIATMGDTLWICMESNDGLIPPSGDGQGTPNPDWAVFFSAPTFRGLTKVEGDPAPTLGGPLNTKGNVIQIRNGGDEHRGMLGEFVSLDGDAVFLSFVGEDGVYEPTDGAMVLKAGRVEAHGASFYLSAFDKPGSGSMQLHISDNGLIYGVEPPAPGWEVFDTDTNNYDLGTGTSTGPWVEMTGLVVSVPEDTPDGVRIDVFANIDATNKTAGRDGTIDVGFGINGAQPTSQSNYSIPGGFDGYVPVNITTTTHGGLTTGDTIGVWARRASGSHGQFGVDLIGADGDPHELIVSKP